MPRNFRTEAIIVAGGARGAEGARVVAMHPNYKEFSETRVAGAVDLSTIYWEELQSIEKDVGIDSTGSSWRVAKTAQEYYLRRRDADRARYWKLALTTLPPFCRALMKTHAGPLRDRTIEVGITMIAWGARGKSPAEIVTWLAPLGSGLIRTVAERYKSVSAKVPETLRAACRAEYDQISKSRTKAHIPSALGRRALATLYKSMPPKLKQIGVKVGTTDLFGALERDRGLELTLDADMAHLTELVNSVFTRSDASKS